MRTTNPALILLGLLSLSSPAKASGRVGNGGIVIICSQSSTRPKQVQLLDYYEAETRRIQIDLGPPELSVESKIELALSRLDRLSPLRANLYRRWAKTFTDEANFFPDTNLMNTDDALNTILPNGCDAKQIVVQKAPQVKEDRLYAVSDDLWRLLDNDEKAGVILHEVIYREAIQFFSHTDSFQSRYFNSYLSSYLMKEFDAQSFARFLLDRGFYRTDIQGIVVNMRAGFPRFHENGGLASARVVDDSSVEVSVSNSGSPWKVSGSIELYPNGMIQSLTLNSPAKAFVGGQSLTLSGAVLFHENGLLKQATLSKSEEPQAFEWRGHHLPLHGSIEFYDTGFPAQLQLKSPVLFQVGDHPLLLDGTVGFHPNGEIKEGSIVQSHSVPLRIETSAYEGDLNVPGASLSFHLNGSLETCLSIYSAYSSCMSNGLITLRGKKVRGNPIRMNQRGVILEAILDQPLSFRVGNQMIPCIGRFEQDSRENLISCRLAKDTEVRVKGVPVAFQEGTPLHFTAEGTVREGTLADSLFGQELLCSDRKKRRFRGDIRIELSLDETVKTADHQEEVSDWSLFPPSFRKHSRTVTDYPKAP